MAPTRRGGLLGRLGAGGAREADTPEGPAVTPVARDEDLRAAADVDAGATRAADASAPATDTPRAPTAGGPSAGTREPGTDGRPVRTSPITADPAPLGLGAFALTTFVLSLFNSGLLPEAGEPVVFGLAFAYGGVAQLLAGMWEFRAGNTFGATAFSSYGAFWISFFLLEVFFADRIPAEELSVYLGWTLIAWAIFTTYMYVASFKVTGAVNVVFLLLAATFYLLGVGEVTGAEIIVRIGGFVGIVTALAAWYASFAIVTNETFRQKVLPVKELE